jgi:hypothetical protein
LIQINDWFLLFVPNGARSISMSITVNPGYHYCEKGKRNVSLEQTEGQCRERHNCGDSPCPVEAEFTPARFPNAFSVLTPYLHDLITKRE